MTQPWSPEDPRLNDYAGYSVASCDIVPDDSDDSDGRSQLAVGAPRAGGERPGEVFVVRHSSGEEGVEHIGVLNGTDILLNSLKNKLKNV